MTILIITIFFGVTGIFNLVLLALFAIASFAKNTPLNEFKIDNSLSDSLYEGKQWVVLVAGTNGWKRYRHQVLKCPQLTNY